MAVRIEKGQALSSLSLTPLIDIVFLLLIFFMVTSRFEQEERRIDINPPQASEAQPAIAQTNELTVTISADGKFYLKDIPYQAEQLEQQLLQAWVNNPSIDMLYIRADKEATAQNIAEVINIGKRANIDDHTLAIE